MLGRDGNYPALGPGALDDRQLDLLDRDRVGVDGEGARRLAGSGADSPRYLGQVVGRVEAQEGFVPVVVRDELVPLGNQVLDRAADRVAVGNTAIDAAPGLLGEHLLGRQGGELGPGLQAFLDGKIRRADARPVNGADFLCHRSFSRTYTESSYPGPIAAKVPAPRR
jgi:hypothetical protein